VRSGAALLINHHQVVTRLDAARVAKMAELIRARAAVAQWPVAWFEVQTTSPAPMCCSVSLMHGGRIGSGAGPRRRRNAGPRSNNRICAGVVGAGFATGLKWELSRKALGTEHVVVWQRRRRRARHFQRPGALDAPRRRRVRGHDDRGAGARRAPRLCLSARRVRYLLEPLLAVLQRRRAEQLLVPASWGRLVSISTIAIHVGAGAYVCGEESALIESLEGNAARRASARRSRPSTATWGIRPWSTTWKLFAPWRILRKHGGAAWAGIGTPKSTGTKIHSVSGDCERPGLYEYPLGTPVSRILADCGAHDTQAVQVGGPSGMCLAPDEFERRIAFEDVPTAGAFMVFDRLARHV